MTIKIRPISELLEYEFIIPKYQRGYRWDEEQIEALLNDLTAFQKGASNDDYYCLQPIVVVSDASDKNRFTVVDGQQRLTSILLILKCLEGINTPCFTLAMEKRKEQEEFIRTGAFATMSDKYKNNIDNFYVKKAFDTISKWKVENPTAAKFISTLFLPDPMKGYAGVIWYEIDQTDAMDAFRRLNYGKIPLTPAELVKAILLQTDCYPENERDLQQALAQRRAMEWDEMEHRLSNPLFFSMVCQKEDAIGNGISIVLDFVADNINSQLKKQQIRKRGNNTQRDNFVYNVIDTKIKEDLSIKKDRKDIIEDIWSLIQETFNRIADWYENREWYHLIGLWRLLSNKKNRNFIADVYKKGVDEEGKPVSKQKFTEALRKHIGDEYIKVPRAKYHNENNEVIFYPDDKQHLNSPDLRYDGTERRKIVNILIALNVMSTYRDANGLVRFPFHLFQQFDTTSLEHIHPQNISENLEWSEAKKWVKDRVSDYNDADEKVWQKVAVSLDIFTIKQNNNDSEENRNHAVKEAKKRVSESIRHLNELMVSKNKFDTAIEEVRQHIKILDTLFGDMAGINGDELHSISNMALVSKELNSALSNNHLDTKRSIAIEKEEEKCTYVPPCTHKVFSKAYRSGTPGNMKFWQPEDRNAYKEEIQKIYDYFIK